MTLHITADAEELSRELADFILDDIREVLKSQERYTLVLSGGSTPKMLYQLLASAPYHNIIPWERVHFFWGDERFVPFEDERNNARMAYSTLLDHVAADPSQIHAMRTDLSPEDAVEQYTQVLKSYFGGSEATFDMVLLGMGDDGHTLSLFPGTEVVHEKERWVSAFFLESQDMYRITLTAPVVNQAHRIAFLATGKNKAHALKEVLEGNPDPDNYPSQVIRAEKGELHWFVDKAAAALLKNTGS